MTRLPLFDAGRAMARDREAILAAITGVVDDGRYILGPSVERFETELGTYLGSPHVIGVASGSDALEIAMRSLGIGPGDAVITTAFTFVATAEAIVNAGATPVFADIRDADWLLDTGALNVWLSSLARDPDGTRRLATGERVRCVLLVHLFGSVHESAEIERLRAQHGLLVIEDTAQALGGKSGRERAGAMSDAGCFSFFPSKTLGCLGDGGAICTPHEAPYAKARALRQHGMATRHRPEQVGRNSRLDAIQAAVLSVKLARLDDDVAERRRLLRRYVDGVRSMGPRVIALTPDVTDGHAGQCVILRVTDRDAARASLLEAGIESATYYEQMAADWAPYRHHPRTGALTVATRATETSLAVPIFPGATNDEIDHVLRALGRHASMK